MKIAGKIWGQTAELFKNSNVEIHRLEIKTGFCSKHKHLHKFNMFFVEKGQVEIKVWKNDYKLVDTTILNTHDIHVVAPGEFHQFKVLKAGVMFEIYWVELTNDIERESIGGQE